MLSADWDLRLPGVVDVNDNPGSDTVTGPLHH